MQYFFQIVAPILMVFLFAVFGKTQDSPHGTLNIFCTDCHDRENFKKIRTDIVFPHDSTGFPLTGMHRSLSCKTCHVTLKFSGTSRDCSQCHQDIHNGELGKECYRCHQTETFAIISAASGFHETTRFPLRGIHGALDCSSCHKDAKKGTWRGLDISCVACHIKDYNATKNPDHRASGIGTDCAHCHEETINFSTFSHSTTHFPLTGAHASVSCAQCHTSGVYTGISTSCNSCHNADYLKTTQPNHTAAKFAVTCESCHTSQAWIPSSYQHASTGYTLTGSHVSVSCTACHKNNVFAGISSLCVSCHESSYTATTNPNHITQQFPRNCETCHTTAGWIPAMFSHSATRFPLTGTHVTVACATCHIDNYAGTLPTECYGCHTADYNSAKEHRSLLFPQDCTQCHSSSVWLPITFTHSGYGFSIYSGDHRDKWQNCSDCHTTPGNFKLTSCLKCHPNGPPRD